jgi:hypothetical protein
MTATAVTCSTPCVQCGLFPDERCDHCSQCPGWHQIDYKNEPDPEL